MAAPASETTQQLSGLLRGVHAAVSAACQPGTDPGVQAVLLPRLIQSVTRPLANAVAGPVPHGDNRAADAVAGPPPAAPAQEPAAPQPAASSAPALGDPLEARLWELAKTAARLRVRLAGGDGGGPPELAEACAALQDLALRLASPGEREQRLTELWELQAGLPTMIQTAQNGPYLVTNLPRLMSHLGLESRPAPQLALCRCGQSAVKPLCDGSHAGSGFTGAKDPKRVADRRDTYRGQQVTVLDNRGICQHAGYCTDRLATVFRAGQEPFVAPSGGRMDEIIRAVRDCPSGALSYAFGGTEARRPAGMWTGTTPAARRSR